MYNILFTYCLFAFNNSNYMVSNGKVTMSWKQYGKKQSQLNQYVPCWWQFFLQQTFQAIVHQRLLQKVKPQHPRYMTKPQALNPRMSAFRHYDKRKRKKKPKRLVFEFSFWWQSYCFRLHYDDWLWKSMSSHFRNRNFVWGFTMLREMESHQILGALSLSLQV
jgi:hypothetical protein